MILVEINPINPPNKRFGWQRILPWFQASPVFLHGYLSSMGSFVSNIVRSQELLQRDVQNCVIVAILPLICLEQQYACCFNTRSARQRLKQTMPACQCQRGLLMCYLLTDLLAYWLLFPFVTTLSLPEP